MTELRAGCVLVLAVTLLPGAAAEAGQTNAWRVGGVVVNSVTGQPMARVRMSLRSTDPPGPPVFAMSDEAGRFSFNDITRGEFDLTAERTGFPRQSLGQKRLGGGFGSAVITGPGLDMEHLVFQLVPASAISGRVTDDQGDPVQHAMVELFRSSVVSGRRRVAIYSYTNTDDVGDFRFSGLGAGSYYLAVSGQPWYGSRNEILPRLPKRQGEKGRNAPAKAAYPLTYYPDATDPRAASTVVLKPGQESVANIAVQTTTGVHVSVALQEATGKVWAALTTPGLEGNDVFLRVNNEVGPAVVFGAITPGRYKVVASSEARPAEVEMKEVEVGDSDVEVQLEPGGTPRVEGKVELDSGVADALRGAYVQFWDPEKNRGSAAPLSPDGSFSMRLAQGRYGVSIGGVKNLSLRELSVDGAPSREAAVDIEQPVTREMKIRATFSSARVQGHVYRGDAVIVGAMVVLVPSAESGNPFDVHAYQTDADGSFDFQAVRPGRYVLLAVEDGTELEYANAAVLAPLRAKGTSIELAPQETLHERIEVIVPETVPTRTNLAPAHQ